MKPDPIRILHARLVRVSEILSEANFSATVARLRTEGCTPEQVTALSATFPQKPQREAVHRLAMAWETQGWTLGGRELASALVALREAARSATPPEIAWSGPTSRSFSYRTTQELLHEMLDRAEQRLLIVSYAVSEVGSLKAHLEAALLREVQIRFVLEHFDVFHQRARTDEFRKLGSTLLEETRIYIWPETKRTLVDGQWRGSLHTKCVVQDTSAVFLTSANWTAAAMAQNMEMGVLVRDGALAARVWDHFDELIAMRVLEEWREQG